MRICVYSITRALRNPLQVYLLHTERMFLVVVKFHSVSQFLRGWLKFLSFYEVGSSFSVFTRLAQVSQFLRGWLKFLSFLRGWLKYIQCILLLLVRWHLSSYSIIEFTFSVFCLSFNKSELWNGENIWCYWTEPERSSPCVLSHFLFLV
jgi:hypothetical protein